MKRKINTSDIPELTEAQLKRARRVTPEETKAFRRALKERRKTKGGD